MFTNIYLKKNFVHYFLFGYKIFQKKYWIIFYFKKKYFF